MRKHEKGRNRLYSLACVGLMLTMLVLFSVHVWNLSESVADTAGAAMYGYGVVNVYPHDAGAYTQGLLYRDGFLFESTGLKGRSTLRKVRLETGELIQQHAVDARYFAEGLTDWGNRLIQLTWLSKIGLIYDLSTFNIMKTFSLSGEGWGLTHDRERLIVSDGSSTLRFLDPVTFGEIGRLPVKDRGKPVGNLNELEFVGDEIFANIWLTDRIARIDPRSGKVTGWINLSGLPSNSNDREAVLNGIAYDAKGDRLFITGKLWPKLFEIRLERQY